MELSVQFFFVSWGLPIYKVINYGQNEENLLFINFVYRLEKWKKWLRKSIACKLTFSSLSLTVRSWTATPRPSRSTLSRMEISLSAWSLKLNQLQSSSPSQKMPSKKNLSNLPLLLPLLTKRLQAINNSNSNNHLLRPLLLPQIQLQLMLNSQTAKPHNCQPN